MAIAEREPIAAVWGQSPPAESRDRAPGRGGQAPLKLKAFFRSANLPVLVTL